MYRTLVRVNIFLVIDYMSGPCAEAAAYSGLAAAEEVEESFN
jgi:predicted NAD/FAD-dependent oxidoreductase